MAVQWNNVVSIMFRQVYWFQLSKSDLLFLNQVATLLSLQGWMNPIPDLNHFQNCGSARTQTCNLFVSILWPLDQRGSQMVYIENKFSWILSNTFYLNHLLRTTSCETFNLNPITRYTKECHPLKENPVFYMLIRGRICMIFSWY